eukprot:c7248_g1_i2.p1 GENE.c7248_g1_i2~~c7248_g1_i2.p1  ORF type:complete len:425 (-),score=109.12 c7248_g1_i2:40-1143(-)
MHGKRTTYFMRREQPPRFSIEQFVMEVAAKVDFPDGLPDEIVGAEYWVQFRQSSEHINFHYDKDEHFASHSQRMLFPVKGTVTYLTDIGAPTVVLNQTTDQFGNTEVPVIPNNGIMSFPVRGRHIWFNGKAQHGVHPQLTHRTGKRRTLLVNWWSKVPEPPNCLELTDEEVSNVGMRLAAPILFSKKWSPAAVVPVEAQTLSLEAPLQRVEIVLPPNDILTYFFPKSFPHSFVKFSLAPENIRFYGEYDSSSSLQLYHINHFNGANVFFFVDNNSQKYEMIDLMAPITWKWSDGGLQLKFLETYIVFTSNVDFVKNVGIENRKHPTVLVWHPKGSPEIYNGQLQREPLEQFFRDYIHSFDRTFKDEL